MITNSLHLPSFQSWLPTLHESGRSFTFADIPLSHSRVAPPPYTTKGENNRASKAFAGFLNVELTAPVFPPTPPPSYHPGRFPIYQRGQMVRDFLRMVSRNPKIVDHEFPKSEPFNRKISEWNGNFRQEISRNLVFPWKLSLFENLANSGKWSHFSEIQIRIFHQLENSVSVLVHAQGSSFSVVG